MLYVIDDFLGDSALARNIKNSHDFFPHKMPGENLGEVPNKFHSPESQVFSPFMFWDGWWKSPANTLKKKMIEKIWKTERLLPFKLSEIAGFEYWTRTFSAGQNLAVHVDADTFAYASNREFNAPGIGCVWHGFTDMPGDGFLELHESVIDGFPENALERKSFEKMLSPSEKRERIAYRPDRLIVFNAGRRIHGVTTTSVGERKVLIVNVWLNSSPPKGLETGQFFYE